MKYINHNETRRFFRFAIVGAIGSVVDFGIFNLLNIVFGLSAVLASMISFTCAVFNNFILNRLWTYPESRAIAAKTQMLQFFFVSMIGLVIRTPMFAYLEKHLIQFVVRVTPQNFAISSQIISHNLALAITIGIVLIWNFLANRFWTYKEVKL